MLLRAALLSEYMLGCFHISQSVLIGHIATPDIAKYMCLLIRPIHGKLSRMGKVVTVSKD